MNKFIKSRALLLALLAAGAVNPVALQANEAPAGDGVATAWQPVIDNLSNVASDIWEVVPGMVGTATGGAAWLTSSLKSSPRAQGVILGAILAKFGPTWAKWTWNTTGMLINKARRAILG